MTQRLIPISVSSILVGVDGSDHSKKATELGVDLALKWNAELYLIQVVEETNIPKGYKKFAEDEHVDPWSYFDRLGEQFILPAEK